MLRWILTLTAVGTRLLDGEPDTGGGGVANAAATQTPPPATQATNAQPSNQDRLVQTLTESLRGTFSGMVETVRQELAATNQRIDQLSQPVADLQSRFNRAPAGVSGPLPGKAERQGYRMCLAAGWAKGSQYATPDRTKYERHVHEKLFQYFCEKHSLELGSSTGSVLVPLGAEYLPNDFELKQELAESMQDSMRGADTEELYWQASRAGIGQHVINQTLSVYDDSKLGIFTREGPQGDMVELLRAQEIFSRLGATNVTLPPSGRLPWPKQTSATTAYWVGEGSEITSSEPGTGSLLMLAKKLAALTAFPNELIRFATQSVEQFIRRDIARVMALKSDRSFIDGVGSTTSPKGILNYDGIKTVTATTTGATGDDLGPNDGARVIATLESENHDIDGGSFAWVMRPFVWQDIYTRRADAVSANDEAGAYMFQVNRANIANGQPMRWEGYPVIKSTQVPNNRVKSSSTDLTCVIAGLWRHWMIGRVGVIEFARADQHSTDFAHDKQTLRAIQHLDAIPRYENAFAVIDDLNEPT